ncbi:universal stress protein [Halalkalirubrum salinum]|uniref:universal stress protein n=1 Tax=Halalkalirubrum salinum TaxID=2563889 RepID=UPI0010FB6354|nr:universal stress protein [Halalkalirubrum salinum]
MYDTILVPTDGSQAAETAADAALVLAQRFDASIHAITVTERDNVPPGVELDATEKLTQRGEETLARFVEQTTEAGVAMTTDLIETSEPIHQAINNYAADNDVDLIVMGTHGRTGLNRFVLGSVTERTLRVSPVPVLTVHEDASLAPGFETILVPTDGSDAAIFAAEHGISLAVAIGASMHVVHITDLTPFYAEFGSAEVLDALEEAGKKAVDNILDSADEANVRSVEASVLSGAPAKALLNYVNERDIDLIVMGTHGRTGLNRYLLGSVTEKIVRLADVPVLTVAPPEDD